MKIIRNGLILLSTCLSLTSHAQQDFTMSAGVIGSVFEDENRDGVRNKGEAGMPGVRLVTQDGLFVETDANGLFHISDLESQGRYFSIKLDEQTLPGDYELTTQNPQVRYASSTLSNFNFGVVQRKK
ncbi:SdrD B-like domain-containing protein [Hydromonas duriensis]|uniref:SdrD B-like protein n=1 Tax=Hydromonas duriensis TaxID=1527608 RepID=A0A4R6Y2K9_9BURK|nr:hypothetical protein [Hydromonas duriensis]TDR30770.1 SdrD B-like protein [Hydromonas duriensis]